MSTELIINASLPETRIALMENGQIQEILIERSTEKGIVGNIYKGRVTRVLPGMQAAFVDIGLEKAAFLYVDDVFVQPEVWEEDEVNESEVGHSAHDRGDSGSGETGSEHREASASSESGQLGESGEQASSESSEPFAGEVAESSQENDLSDQDDDEDFEVADLDDEDGDEDSDDGEPVAMGGDEEGGNSPEGTLAPGSGGEGAGGGEGGESTEAAAGGAGGGSEGAKRRHRRGRRGGRNRRRRESGEGSAQHAGGGSRGVNHDDATDEATDDASVSTVHGAQEYESVSAPSTSDRAEFSSANAGEAGGSERPEGAEDDRRPAIVPNRGRGPRPEFKEPRSRDRRVKGKSSSRPSRANVNIQDLLQEGQEVLVQVAKDPISTKGARLTCHISLPGRHLVCMPTIDHVGVSRRIERDDERRKLRDFVERNRPKNLGFIVRTASGKGQSERRIKQDIDYLSRLWSEIREKAANTTAPSLVYEDLNVVLRSIRDWVTEEIDKIVVDSRYHFNEMQKFISHFMPAIKQRVELYHGDIPIFDAYGITSELSRALDRKVWLKSGGYIVIDQAEALVAIDVNTGRYVGKKNLEDTILKTNLEAVQEIAYQLRLRNCGGIIILDLIDMEKEENKQRVYRALEDALRKDRARPMILKISELGLVEMTRKRTRDTLTRAMCDSCSSCEGKGYIKSKHTVAYEIMREIERVGIDRDVSKILIQANPDVIDVLAIEERGTLDQLERRYRNSIYLQAVGDYHAEQFDVATENREGERKGRAESRSEGQRTQAAGESNRNRGGGRDRGRDRNRDRGGSDRNASGSGGGDRERGGGDRERGGRDRDRGRDRGRDRDRNRDRGDRDRNRDEGQSQQSYGAQEPGQPSGDSEVEPGNSVFGNSSRRPQGPARDDIGNTGAPAPQQFDDDMSEEDRLAFLRAQAAQDAALAKGEPANGNTGGQRRGPHGGGGGGNRDRNDRGGGRGGRGGRGRRGGRGGRGNRPSGQGFSQGGQRHEGLPRDVENDQDNRGGNADNKREGRDPRDSGDGGPGDHTPPPV